MRFPDGDVGAPLKPEGLGQDVISAAMFPRRRRRGPIEAG